MGGDGERAAGEHADADGEAPDAEVGRGDASGR